MRFLGAGLVLAFGLAGALALPPALRAGLAFVLEAALALGAGFFFAGGGGGGGRAAAGSSAGSSSLNP